MKMDYIDPDFSFFGASDSGSFDASWDGDPLSTSTIPTESDAYPCNFDPVRPYYFEGDLFEIVAEGKTECFHSLSVRLTDHNAGILPSPVVSYPVVGSNYPLAADEIDFVPSPTAPSPTAQPHAPTSSSSICDAPHPQHHSLHTRNQVLSMRERTTELQLRHGANGTFAKTCQKIQEVFDFPVARI